MRFLVSSSKPKPAGADCDLVSGTGPMEADAVAGGVMGMAREGSSKPKPCSAFAQKGRRASSPAAPRAPGAAFVAIARTRARASATVTPLGLRMLGEGPAEDPMERGDPRYDVCMGEAPGEMGTNECLTRSVVSDGDECERARPVDALLQAEAQREFQRLPEW